MPRRHPFVQGIPLDTFSLTVRLRCNLPLAAFLRLPIQLERSQVGDAHDGEADGFEAVIYFAEAKGLFERVFWGLGRAREGKRFMGGTYGHGKYALHAVPLSVPGSNSRSG